MHAPAVFEWCIDNLLANRGVDAKAVRLWAVTSTLPVRS